LFNLKQKVRSFKLHKTLQTYFGWFASDESFKVPFNIQRGIGKKFFLTGGVTLIRQLKGSNEHISSLEPQKVPEYNWQFLRECQSLAGNIK